MNAASPASSPPRRRLRPVLLLLAVTAALVGSSTAVAVADPSTDAAATPAGRYYPVTPKRVLDTRNSGGPIATGANRVIDLSSALGGADAAAAVINLTVTAPTGSGYLTVYPAGTDKPLASSLNFASGETRANSVTVAVGQDADQNELAISPFVQGSGGRAHVIVDVVGYYGNGGGAAGTDYVPLNSPSRLFDTRATIGGLTNTYPKNTGIVTLNYGSAAINKTISAAAINITVTGTRGSGNLTIWDGFGAPPLVSTINFGPGQTIANLAIIPVRCSDSTCKTLTFSIRNNNSPYTQVLGDIAGAYFTPSANGLLYQAVSPTRITDTRLGMPYGRLGQGSVGVTNVTRYIPAGADVRALNINLTGVNPSTATYLSVYPAGTPRSTTSNLNLPRGAVAANAAQVKISATGAFATYNYAGTVDVVIDLQGLFARDTAAAAKSAAGTAVSGRVS